MKQELLFSPPQGNIHYAEMLQNVPAKLAKLRSNGVDTARWSDLYEKAIGGELERKEIASLIGTVTRAYNRLPLENPKP